MSDSDESEDCYGGVALSLQKMKNNYMGDKLDSIVVLKQHTEMDEIIEKTTSTLQDMKNFSTTNPPKLPRQPRKPAVRKTPKNKNQSTDTTNLDESSSDSIPLATMTLRANNTSTATTSRGAASSRGRGADSRRGRGRPPRRGQSPRRGQTPRRATPRRGQSPRRATPRRGTSRRSRLFTGWFHPDMDLEYLLSLGSFFRRGSGRTPRRGRASRRVSNSRRAAESSRTNDSSSPMNDSGSPIMDYLSIGNTDFYPDQSEQQTLFSVPSTSQADDVIAVDDLNDSLNENEELSVKVYWQNCDIFKFTIRRHQKLTQIFEYFSNRETLTFDKLLLTYNGKILKPDDTPDTIDYSVAKFIDGGIVKNSIASILQKDGGKIAEDAIILKFQCQHLKRPIELQVSMDDNLSMAMLKCAEQLEIGLELLKFYFDGDLLNGKQTPRQLELEGGECIDVKSVC